MKEPMMNTQKPQPRINSVNRPFWDACNSGKLSIQKCDAPSCGKWFYFPRVGCPHCGSTAFSWKEASGRGTIVSYTVIRRAQHPSFAPELPYYFIAVRLDEGPLMYSRLAGPYRPDLDLMSREVSVVFAEHSPDLQLPFFSLT